MSDRWHGNRTWRVRLLIWRYGYDGAEQIIRQRLIASMAALAAGVSDAGDEARKFAAALDQLSERLHPGRD